MSAVIPRTDLGVLHDELEDVAEKFGRASHEYRMAFERWFNTSAKAGRSPDALNRWIEDETERFFSYVIQGTDKHVYWNGPRYFDRNDGSTTRPARWWWGHVHGPISRYADLTNTCGEAHCINPDHQETGRLGTRREYSEMQMIGAVQAVAMRIGRSPTTYDYDAAEGRKPHSRAIRNRLGTWADVLRICGLPPTVETISPEACIAAIRTVAEAVGRPPRQEDMYRQAPALKSAGLPSSPRTIARRTGLRWSQAVVLALGEAA